MKRIEWTWPNGAKSYSVPFTDEFAQVQLDYVKSGIAEDLSCRNVSVQLVDAEFPCEHKRPQLKSKKNEDDKGSI